ncbi:DNA polymerase IV [Cellulomonas sp. Leaf334]|uniref:DNA polymerase Y family protein n=1 Tax=Cellulomonas sp. Leaf334 TaxID=1736339 RepID=UPI0006F62700|nr:DNA polymerase IV [Cellulomonas sp. Leaf334]KQR11153.1 DNA polymerase IV [Cellulomonas sp. Leaf334]
MNRAPRSARTEQDRGHEEAGCSILHVDLDAFVASVELARRPQLRGLPVVVGSATGVVVAATYEARAFGVHPETPMATALLQCPQAVVVPPDHHAYREVSAGVMRVLGDVTALVEQVGVDGAFLDVAGARRRWGPPTVIADLIRRQVREQFGLTCSVGIGSTKLVARLASGRAKPDGVLLVPRAATVDFLRDLPVGALLSVGEKAETALAGRGIRTVAELADADVSVVQHAVGRVAGAHLVDLAWGRDPRPVSPGRDVGSIDAEESFGTPVADLAAVEEKAHELADRCAVRLRANGLVSRTITVKIRTTDRRTLTRSRSLVTPTDIGRELFLAARGLVAGVDLRGAHVRLVGVRADGLSRAPTSIRQPTPDEASDVPVRAWWDAERALGELDEGFESGPIGAGASQPGGVSSRSTTTIVPADLS